MTFILQKNDKSEKIQINCFNISVHQVAIPLIDGQEAIYNVPDEFKVAKMDASRLACHRFRPSTF